MNAIGSVIELMKYKGTNDIAPGNEGLKVEPSNTCGSECQVEAVGNGNRDLHLEMLLNCCRRMGGTSYRCRRENTSD